MNPGALADSKALLRRQMLSALGSISTDERQDGSERLRALLTSQATWKDAGSVLLYAPMSGELDVWPLAEQALREGKRVGLPRYIPEKREYMACEIENAGNQVQVGYYGIREPTGDRVNFTLNRLDLILVPGIAFDPRGRRLGRGKGYYDKLLAVVAGAKCGVAFELQIVPELPATSHDVSMSFIITPTRWIAC